MGIRGLWAGSFGAAAHLGNVKVNVARFLIGHLGAKVAAHKHLPSAVRVLPAHGLADGRGNLRFIHTSAGNVEREGVGVKTKGGGGAGKR